MKLVINPLNDTLGAEIIGGDYSKQLNSDEIIILNQAFLKYHLVCLRSNKLTPKEFLKLANYFGKPFTEVTRNHWIKDAPEISKLDSTYKSLDEKPKDPNLNRRSGWHTDHSFKQFPPKATLLHGLKIPSLSGHTRFCNTRKAYEDLSLETKIIYENLMAVHSYETIRAPARPVKRSKDEIKETPDVVHPLVRIHDETGKKSLYFNANRTDHIVGLTREKSDKLLDTVHNHITQDKYRYDHKWVTGDIIIWDNRCLIHSVNVDYPVGEERIHLRTLLRGNEELAL